MGGFERPFAKGNKDLTTPAKEWAITVCGDDTDVRISGSRSLIPISELMTRDVVKQAALTSYEVIAVVLYTGPMVSQTHFV